jgi:hypothetical protein
MSVQNLTINNFVNGVSTTTQEPNIGLSQNAISDSGYFNLSGDIRGIQISNRLVTDQSPFQCDPQSFEGDTFPYPHTELEPTIAVGVNPLNPSSDIPMVVIGWQQDRYSKGGGANGSYICISLDGGTTFGTPLLVPDVLCNNQSSSNLKRYERSTDTRVKISKTGLIYIGTLPFI